MWLYQREAQASAPETTINEVAAVLEDAQSLPDSADQVL